MFWKTLRAFSAGCFLLTAAAFAQNANFTPRELSGHYSMSSAYGSSDLALNEDGTYFAGSTSDICEVNPKDPNDCLNYYQESGTFSIAGNVVKFNILKYRRYDPEDKLKDKPPQNYEFLIIKWSERFYLLREDSLKDFANAINMKMEPRQSTLISRYDYFYLRREGTEKPVAGLPDLPGGWNDFLLKKRVTATILRIKIQNGKRIAVIDRGTDDGLKVGMQMIARVFPDGSEIVSVNKSLALVELTGETLKTVKKGDQVTTNYDSNNWYLKLKPRVKK
jgi:hypothetical protein